MKYLDCYISFANLMFVIPWLVYLIRFGLTIHFQSHFLKVPSLPFHSIISLLAKFPVDVDSRVFWSTGVRDVLFGTSFAHSSYYQKLSLSLPNCGHQTLHIVSSDVLLFACILVTRCLPLLPQWLFRIFSREQRKLRSGPRPLDIRTKNLLWNQS